MYPNYSNFGYTQMMPKRMGWKQYFLKTVFSSFLKNFHTKVPEEQKKPKWMKKSHVVMLTIRLIFWLILDIAKSWISYTCSVTSHSIQKTYQIFFDMKLSFVMQKKLVPAMVNFFFERERFQIHNSKQHLLLKCNFKLHLKLKLP